MALATLTIDLVAKLGSLEQDLGKVSHLAEQAGDRIQSAFAAIGTTLSVGAFGALIKGSIDAQDRLDKLRLTTSLTIDQLSGLKFAAAIAGGDLESMAVSIDKLAANMGKDPEKFKALGIAAKDPLEAFKQLADIFVTVQDPQLRAALGATALGKAWAGAAPLLMEGSRGIGELIEKGARLSGVSAQSAAAAAEFNDKWHELFGTGQLVNSMVGDLLPLLNFLAGDLIAARDGATGLNTEFSPLLETGKAIAVLFGNVSFVLKATGTEIGGIAAQMAALARGDLTMAGAIGDIMKQDAAAARREFDEWETKILGLSGKATTAVKDAAKKVRDGALEGRVSTFVSTAGAGAGGKAPGSYTDYASRINQAVAGDINSSAIVKAAELADKIEILDKLFFDSGLDADIYTSALEKMTGMTANVIKETDRLNKLLEATPTAKLEESRKDMQLLADALTAGKISEDQFTEAAMTRLGQLGEAVKETDTFARDMGLTFASAFEDAIVGGKSLSQVLKGLGQDIERILIRKTVTEPAGNFLTDLLKGFSFGGGYGDTAGLAAGVPRFASGTDYVPRDMLAVIHKGEAVIPAAQNRASAGRSVVINQNISIDSRSDRSTILAAMAQAKAETLAAVESNMRRGGSLARAARSA